MVLAPTLVQSACSSAPRSEPAAPEAPSPVEELLSLSELESVTVGRARTFTRQVALLAGDLTDEELSRLVTAVREGFDPLRMRRDVAQALLDRAPEGRIDEVLSFQKEGATAEVRAIVSAYDPPVPLREWLETYTDQLPSADRVRLMARWAEARGEGVFYMLLEQALDESAHRVWAAFRSTAPPFEPLRGDELRGRLDTSTLAATARALHTHEPVSDDLLRAAAADYESEVGQWYVEAYQLAVAEAVRASADHVLERLARS